MADQDEDLQLSASTLAALLEFKKEEEQRQEEFERLQNVAQERYEETKLNEVLEKKGMELFQEDWGLSQFWYNDETANLLADELLEGADEDTVVCVVSAPSVYAAIKKRDQSKMPTKHIYLFEYDKRFKVLDPERFGFYDYKNPLDILPEVKGKVHRLLIDPPFLQDDCQSKIAQTAHALLHPDRSLKTKTGELKYRLISCTGERMKDIIRKNYPDTRPTTFIPEHANGLSNEFFCYASYEGKSWKFLPDN